MYVTSASKIISVFFFKQTAAKDMETTVREMEEQGVHSYIMDLRNNPVELVFLFMCNEKIG